LLALVLAGVSAPGKASETTAGPKGGDIIIRPIPLDADDPARNKAGSLEWRGGIEIIHDDARFGGLSGLHVSPDGRRMVAVTDRGARVSARLTYRQGKLTGITHLKIRNLKGPGGKRIKGSWRDAESLALDGDGGLLVAFERRHRIWRYRPRRRKPPLSGRPTPVAGPDGIESQPRNGGIEALARLCDGRLLAISEKLRAGPGSYRGWIRGSAGWAALAYASKDGFRPTGAATLPDCDIVVVERHFTILSGVRARLVRIAADAVKPGAVLSGEELAELAPPMNVDNMEGVAARRGANGETLLYLVSDDNFSGLQRTLLLLFALPSGAAASGR
jgi:hypothetical protein